VAFNETVAVLQSIVYVATGATVLDVIVIGTVAVQELIVLVTTHEYVPGAVTSKLVVLVCVQTAVVFVAVNAVTVNDDDKQLKLALKGFIVYVGASVKLAIETVVAP
jgi:hypothetical protein